METTDNCSSGRHNFPSCVITRRIQGAKAKESLTPGALNSIYLARSPVSACFKCQNELSNPLVQLVVAKLKFKKWQWL